MSINNAEWVVRQRCYFRTESKMVPISVAIHSLLGPRYSLNCVVLFRFYPGSLTRFGAARSWALERVELAKEFKVFGASAIRGLMRPLTGCTSHILRRTFLGAVTTCCTVSTSEPCCLAPRFQVSILLTFEASCGEATTFVRLNICYLPSKVHNSSCQ